MRYKSFYIRIKPVDNLIRQDKQGSDICCKGYEVWCYTKKMDSKKRKMV